MPGRLDARGPRFAAAVTSVVLALALVLGAPWGLLLLAGQTLVFAIGAFFGAAQQPYGVVFRKFVRPRLSDPRDWEDPKPPRFAQAVGLVFAVVGLLGGALGAPIVFYAATALALVAALLNAVFNICLGCEMYVRLARVQERLT